MCSLMSFCHCVFFTLFLMVVSCLYIGLRSVGTFARAMITSKNFQPTLHASAAAASRDTTLVQLFSPSLHVLAGIFQVLFISFMP